MSAQPVPPEWIYGRLCIERFTSVKPWCLAGVIFHSQQTVTGWLVILLLSGHCEVVSYADVW